MSKKELLERGREKLERRLKMSKVEALATVEEMRLNHLKNHENNMELVEKYIDQIMEATTTQCLPRLK